jgi:hypothetical protein
MALEPKYFGLDIEPEKRGQGAWDRNTALKLSGASGMIESSFDTTAPIEVDNGGRKRRLRRTGSQIAQQGIWDGILGGVTDAQTQADINLRARNTMNADEGFRQLPISIVEEPAEDGLRMDLDGLVPGLFEGLAFYTWGFTDKKVSAFRSRLTIREKSLRMLSRTMQA